MSHRAATSTPRKPAAPAPTIDLPRDIREVVDALRSGPMLLTTRELAALYGRDPEYWRRWAEARAEDGVGFRDGQHAQSRWMIRAEAVARWIETQYAVTALTPQGARRAAR